MENVDFFSFYVKKDSIFCLFLIWHSWISNLVWSSGCIVMQWLPSQHHVANNHLGFSLAHVNNNDQTMSPGEPNDVERTSLEKKKPVATFHF